MRYFKGTVEKTREPFYSSKEKGTGLGLTVSYKIVQSHNGTIQFDSEKNKGTEVNIVLPTGIENTVEPTPEVIKEIGA